MESLSTLLSDKERMEELRQANGNSCQLVVVVTGIDNAPIQCGGSISSPDKREREGGGGGGILDGSQGKRTQSSITERCAGQEPAGRPVESEWVVYRLLIVCVCVWVIGYVKRIHTKHGDMKST